jgi:2-iminobutanoate/2-iminopropanoate deaminase
MNIATKELLIMKTTVHSGKAPQAVGPYSQAVKIGKLLFVSGQLGLTIEGGFAGADIASQTRQSLENIKAILTEAGFTMDDVLKATIFLTDLNDFAQVNAIYQEYFAPPYPARACVQVGRLPRDGQVEIEVIAGIE